MVEVISQLFEGLSQEREAEELKELILEIARHMQVRVALPMLPKPS